VPLYRLFDPGFYGPFTNEIAKRRLELWQRIAEKAKDNAEDRRLFLTVLERELVYGTSVKMEHISPIQKLREQLLGKKIRPYPGGLELMHFRHLGRLAKRETGGEVIQWSTDLGMISREERELLWGILPLVLAYWRRELESPQPLTIAIPENVRRMVAYREVWHLAKILPPHARSKSYGPDLEAIWRFLQGVCRATPDPIDRDIPESVLERLWISDPSFFPARAVVASPFGMSDLHDARGVGLPQSP
jgi:hypothetical protein